MVVHGVSIGFIAAARRELSESRATTQVVVRKEKDEDKKYGALLESVMGWGHRDSKLAPEKVRNSKSLTQARKKMITVLY
jgi:hypothetical protein